MRRFVTIVIFPGLMNPICAGSSSLNLKDKKARLIVYEHVLIKSNYGSSLGFFMDSNGFLYLANLDCSNFRVDVMDNKASLFGSGLSIESGKKTSVSFQLLLNCSAIFCFIGMAAPLTQKPMNGQLIYTNNQQP